MIKVIYSRIKNENIVLFNLFIFQVKNIETMSQSISI